ncbi:MAG: hypothetical protein U5M53_13705 [Rhodoferax sp.]|nr:hypothetical protein [Rhodoferax sp.]
MPGKTGRQLRPRARDLFGQVPVTHRDIDLWLLHVHQVHPESPRAAYFVRGWNVPEKVRQAKLAGTFEHLTCPAA